MRLLAGGLLRSLVVFGLAEAVLWALAWAGVISLPSSVPMSGFDQVVLKWNPEKGQRLYEPGRWTLRRLRPNADVTYPRHPVYSGGPDTYHVRTNSMGMRDRELSHEKPAGTLRVACLGDSSTFGYNVEVDEAYPHLLQALLDAAYPGKFQVLNFGVPGDTFLEGVEVLKHRVLEFQPDVVTMAFGTNDRFWHGPTRISEQLRVKRSLKGLVIFQSRRILNLSAVYRSLRIMLARVGGFRLLQARGNKNAPVVSLDEIADAIVESGELAQRTAFSLLILNLDLQRTDAVNALASGAKEIKAPFLNLVDQFTRKRVERDLAVASRLGLVPSTVPTRTSRFVFRVVTKGHPTSVLVRHHGFLKPLKAAKRMYDDGTHGDERAGDGVWSLATGYAPGNIVFYSYLSATGGRRPVREFSDSFVKGGVALFGTAERKLIIEVGGPHIDIYGRQYLMADSAHPNAEGHKLIATRLRDAILRLPSVRQTLATGG